MVALTWCPSDWLIDDDETDVPSNHLPRRVFPVRLQNLSQRGVLKWFWRIGTRCALTSLFALTLFILPRFIFFDRKWSYCWVSGEEEADVLPWVFRSEEEVIFFFYHRKTCGGSMGLFCECLGNVAMLRWRDVAEWYFIVILYVSKSDVWILTVWYVNLQSGKIVQA